MVGMMTNTGDLLIISARLIVVLINMLVRVNTRSGKTTVHLKTSIQIENVHVTAANSQLSLARAFCTDGGAVCEQLACNYVY